MNREDQELIIDVDLPDDIDIGLDFDGLPMVVPKEKEKPAVKVAAKPEAEKPAPKQPDYDRDDLLRQRDEAARARQQAEAAAEAERASRKKAEEDSLESRQVALRAHWAKVQADAQAIDATLASTKTQMEMARAEYLAAAEASDEPRKLKAQEILTQAQQDYRELENGKRGVEAEAKRVRAAWDAEAAREPAAAADPPKKETAEPKQTTPEEWIDGVRKSVGGQVADWLAANKQFVTDPKLNAKVIAFSQYYTSVEEKPLNDPDFIAALTDKFLPKPAANKHEEPDDVADEDVEVERPAKATPSVPSAPVSRASSPAKASGGGSMKVKLTPEQAAIAPQLYPDAKTPQEARQAYALDLIRAQKEGRFENRT